ncbi:MAG: TraR/DksA C4-type zinc finger protein, partial [Bacillota bacterium]
HPGDVGSEVFERSKDFALRENALLTIKAIDNALASIEKGIYGRCEACGGEIPVERLESLPYTTLCIKCKENGESKLLESSRPVEEAVMRDIYSKPFDDRRSNVEADWEDFFQEVADWNEHAALSGAGSYYGGGEPVEEDGLGSVEDVENIAYEIGEDGIVYKDFSIEGGGDVPREDIKLDRQD